MRVMERLLEIWGDMDGVANALDTPYPTISSWNSRGIPLRRVKNIIQTARRAGHVVHPWDLHADFEYLRPETAA